MEPFSALPDRAIAGRGIVSGKFLGLGIRSFRDACRYVHGLPYGYNSDRDDLMILFKDGYGSCSTKHAVIAVLASELELDVVRMTGIHAMTEEIVTGAGKILKKHKLPYVPMIHCFLAHDDHRVDLSEGNNNGKNRPLEDFLFTQKVKPDISEKDEYLVYRTALVEHVLRREEMQGIVLAEVLRARLEGIELLKSKIPDSIAMPCSVNAYGR